jgi:TatD DNase family protein
MGVGSCHESNRLVIRLTERYPEFVFGAIGYDRDQATRAPSIAALDDLLHQVPQVRAVGEIGLDYHYHAETARQQRRLFERMLEVARTHGKPVSIHSREADADTLAILDEHIQELGGGVMSGILHCFTGCQAFADELLARGLYISFSGIVTFGSAGALRAVAQTVPLDRLLVETDCPYLAPVPHRGKQNEPAFVEFTLRTLAERRGERVEKLAACTSANARALLKLSK